MPVQHSAGAIIFRKKGNTRLYLLLEYHPGYWGLAKGAVESGESVQDTARREVLEETGLRNIRFLEGFRRSIRYFYRSEGERVFKTVTFFLAESASGDVKISYEHSGFVWLPYNEAVEKITYPNEKRLLQQAEEFISGRE